ncbi:Chemotaxis protein PomA [Vibrio stylophorae]|uniref:Chemotaxis protein PomA n=1 Tax=Vibrio stylophorae TaxID=659351 RepID=A0ABN8DW13_9VIBR|nr:flagellar motor protein [Vibrio stylophorae]CAH0535616.1 Chemotaxis protein PomA [Vibrio stylophorae]
MSLIGIFVALGFVLFANIIEGGHPSALLNGPAFLIVLGGTIGAVLVQFPFRTFGDLLRRLKWLLKPPSYDLFSTASDLENLATISRREGLLALETELEKYEEPFLKRSLQMLIDGMEREALLDILDSQVENQKQRTEQIAKIYEAMGGYCPTMGILGAVLGLIHAMGLLDKPEELGHGIAVAFVATIYGVAFANIVFLPFGNRYKAFAEEQANYYRMISEGVFCIASGSSQLELQRRLGNYVAHPKFTGEGEA